MSGRLSVEWLVAEGQRGRIVFCLPQHKYEGNTAPLQECRAAWTHELQEYRSKRRSRRLWKGAFMVIRLLGLGVSGTIAWRGESVWLGMYSTFIISLLIMMVKSLSFCDYRRITFVDSIWEINGFGLNMTLVQCRWIFVDNWFCYETPTMYSYRRNCIYFVVIALLQHIVWE